MTEISPMLQAQLNQKTSQINATKMQQVPNLTTKSDSVELSGNTQKQKMSKTKKALLIGASVVGALAITAGVIALIHKGHIKNIQKEGATIQENAQKIVDEIMAKFEKGENIQVLEDGSKVLEELAEDGTTLFRKSTLDLENILTIDNFIEKTRIEARDGILGFYYKKSDFSQIENGIFKAKENFYFKDGKISQWDKNFQADADGSWSADKGIVFKDGKISQWYKNFQKNADGSQSADKEIDFKDGKISQWDKNVQVDADGNWSADKEIDFEDGKISQWNKNFQADADGSWSADKEIDFDGLKITFVNGDKEKEIDLNLFRVIKNLIKKGE